MFITTFGHQILILVTSPLRDNKINNTTRSLYNTRVWSDAQILAHKFQNKGPMDFSFGTDYRPPQTRACTYPAHPLHRIYYAVDDLVSTTMSHVMTTDSGPNAFNTVFAGVRGVHNYEKVFFYSYKLCRALFPSFRILFNLSTFHALLIRHYNVYCRK